MSIYLVTGVAGFIGSSIAEYLLKKNYLVIGIDNFDNYFLSQIYYFWMFYFIFS